MTGPSGNPLPTRSYDYDPSGNITRRSPAICREVPSPHVFEYDLMDRLSQLDHTPAQQALTYDANGNRLSLIRRMVSSSDYSYDPVARNILAGSTGA